MNSHNTDLTYTDNDGAKRHVEGCTMTVDRAGRYWLWSEQVSENLAYEKKTREDCLLSAISSLLFTIHLRDKRIAKLQHIANLAETFADQVKPDELTN